MRGYAEWMSKLVESLTKLPGIGRKSAERIVFYVLKANKPEIHQLSQLLVAVKDNVSFCKTCHNYSDGDECEICQDGGRDRGIICVVEDPKDVIAVEKTGSYAGVYHVLLGTLSALDGIGPDEIHIPDLMKRIETGKVREVILATNPNTEGETTALYLAKAMRNMPIKVTRIARGIPIGSFIEFSDQATLARALDGRVTI